MYSPTDGLTGPIRGRITGAHAPSSEADAEYLVLGGGHLGAAIAGLLHADGRSVRLVDETHDSTDVPGVQGRPDDPSVLDRVGVSDTSRVVVATPRDSRNLLIAQLVKTRFGVLETFVVVNAPERRAVVAEAGHRPVCVTRALSETVVGQLASTTTDGDSIA
ncbi:NAD-binding protein [Halorarius halobius]|uniref:NAD-binding protein n=1 Tax=Halorarius halobius TaxID=2962671 RepID=UPI0020CF1CB6|nr:NAD-binding protein [Halorarius halobius]